MAGRTTLAATATVGRRFPNNQNNGRNLNFNSSNVNPLNNNNRAYGFGVRSSQEFILVRGRESFECKLQKWLNVIRDRICLRIVFQAYYEARKKKRNTASQLAFEIDLEHNLMELYEQIRDRNYTPSPGVCFVVNRPVKRENFCLGFQGQGSASSVV